MPFYEYKCAKCEEKFEIKKSMNDPTEPACPHCQGKTQRVFTSPGIIGSSSGGHGSSCTSCKSGGCSSCSCH